MSVVFWPSRPATRLHGDDRIRNVRARPGVDIVSLGILAIPNYDKSPGIRTFVGDESVPHA